MDSPIQVIMQVSAKAKGSNRWIFPERAYHVARGNFCKVLSMMLYTNVPVSLPLFSGLVFLVNCVPVVRLGYKVKLSWTLSSIIRVESGEYSLTYETTEGVVSLQSRTVVMTIPSYVASTLLRPLSVSFFLELGLYPMSMRWLFYRWNL